jgi:hypothetical protein
MVLQASNTGQLGYNVYNRDLQTSTQGRIFLLFLLKSHLIFNTLDPFKTLSKLIPSVSLGRYRCHGKI